MAMEQTPMNGAFDGTITPRWSTFAMTTRGFLVAVDSTNKRKSKVTVFGREMPWISKSESGNAAGLDWPPAKSDGCSFL